MSNLKTTTDYVLACITHVGALMLMPGSEEMEAALDLEARGLAMVSFKRGIERKNKTRLSWFVEKSENTRQDAIRAYFQENPEVTMVCTEFGHGYAKARYTGWCKLTNTRIDCGESIRKVSITTRDSRSMQLFMSSRRAPCLGSMMSESATMTMAQTHLPILAPLAGAATQSSAPLRQWRAAIASKSSLSTVSAEHTSSGAMGSGTGARPAALSGTLRRSKNAAMIRVTAD